MNPKNDDKELLSFSADELIKKYMGQAGETAPSTAHSLFAPDKYAAVSTGKKSPFKIDGGRLYAHYKNLYTENALRAGENAYGLASALTGGYSNTFASALANEAYSKYMEGLYDRLDEVSRRSFSDSLSLAKAAADYGDYSFFTDMGVDMSGERRKDALTEAMDFAKYGDFTALESLGVDTAPLRYSQLLDLAQGMAEFGDYSGLEALGIDTEIIRDEKLLKKAAELAKYGDYSLLGQLSDNLAKIKPKISYTVQKGAEDAYYYRGYSALVRYLNRQIGYGQITEAEKNQIIKTLTGA